MKSLNKEKSSLIDLIFLSLKIKLTGKHIMKKLSAFKALGLSLMLAISLSACSKYGELKSDQVLGTINHEAIHKLVYGSDDVYDISLYYPVDENKNDSKSKDSQVEVRDTDQYGTTEVNRYDFPSDLTEKIVNAEDYLYIPSSLKIDNSQNEIANNQIFNRNHYYNDDGVVGTFVNGQFNLEIHQMSHLFESDKLYVAVVHPNHQKNATSENLSEKTVLGNYQDSTIYQLHYKAISFFDRAPDIFIAINHNGKLIPLNSKMTYVGGNNNESDITVRNTLILLDENGHLINHNQLSDKNFVLLNKEVKKLAKNPLVENKAETNYEDSQRQTQLAKAILAMREQNQNEQSTKQNQFK